MHPTTGSLGVIAGLGRIGGADLRACLARRLDTDPARTVLFERAPHGHGTQAEPDQRKLYVHDMALQLCERGAARIMLPCFISQTFLPELQPETRRPFVGMMDALRAHCTSAYRRGTRIGVLTSDHVRRARLFETALGPHGFTILHPGAASQAGCVMPALYGPAGLQCRGLGAAALDLLRAACADLVARGADVILAGASEFALAAGALRRSGFGVVDTLQVYLDYAVRADTTPAPAPPARLGVVGGIGPAATVDFLGKVVAHTRARRDQDHLPIIVDHNPRIPDRTAHLVGGGADPLLALYAACRRLESNGATLIAVPCNTAHAYLPRIQPRLAVPVVHMLDETVGHIVRHYPDCRTVGLLATTGTIASGVYHAAARAAPFELIVPSDAGQRRVMGAIYGEHGVKAGHTTGPCRDDLAAAIGELAGRGAGVIILGCTELPLVLPAQAGFDAGGVAVDLVDPTLVLARRCIERAGYATTPTDHFREQNGFLRPHRANAIYTAFTIY
ncbi:amino acid racemase [Massilia luteola]|uniref:amino acid racemase n=1 Tax=Massilia luteola TaxID=3081751 RepID=UPI002ACC1A97|nr:amino acid racemase [Massilia sp. Gc5]